MASKGNFEGTIAAVLGGTVAAGDVGIFRGILGQYLKGGVSGETVPFQTDGYIKEAPKVGSQAWTAGDIVYWDTVNSRFTKTAAAGCIPGGIAAVAVGSGAGATTGDVILRPGALKVAYGQHTTVAAADTVVTGLSTVLGVVAQLDSDPVDGAMHVTSSIGDQAGAPAAGSVLLNTWKSTDGDATLIAATTFSKKVNWIAFGI